MAVFGVDDEKFGQRLKAVVVKNGATLSEEDVKDYVKPNLAGYKVAARGRVRRRAAAHLDRQGAQARAQGRRRRGVRDYAALPFEACPSAPTSSISARLGLTSGEGRRLDLHVALEPVPLRRRSRTPSSPS